MCRMYGINYFSLYRSGIVGVMRVICHHLGGSPLLWFSQIFEDQLHLAAGEAPRGTLVAYLLKCWEQAVGRGDVLVQQAQG